VSADEPTAARPKAGTGDEGEAFAKVIEMAKASAAGLPDPSAWTSNTKPRIKRARNHKQPMFPSGNGLSAFAAAPWFGRNANYREDAPFASGGWGCSR
jgi:hypothetical protein